MKAAVALLLHCSAGVILTLASTFAGERSARAIYPDIMGCEASCTVVATGWPFVFVRDYLGMSVIDTADIMEVWFAADRFAWLPFWASVAVWSLVCLGASNVFRRLIRRVRQGRMRASV